MTSPLEQQLDALDWETIRCQCGNHTGDGCPDHAAHHVEVHGIDRCKHPNLNADGNAVALLCDRCLGDLRARMKIAVESFNARGQIRCRTCAFPLTRPEHVIRKVLPL